MTTAKKRYKYTTARQVGGDDGYCWTVFVNGRERVNGLTKREVIYYRDRFEKEEEAKHTNNNELKAKVQSGVCKLWPELAMDAAELGPLTLDIAVELCLDADRLVSAGYLSAEDYKAMLALPNELVDGWAKEALKGVW